MEQINNLFVQVTGKEFQASLKRVQDKYPQIKQATTPWNEIDLASNFFIAGYPAFMGYAVSENGELTSVFSCVKGKGDAIMQDAIQNGAKHLDCFDGYLPTLYKKYGFREVKRELNWTAGQPDIIYMERA